MALAEKRKQFANSALYVAPIAIGNLVPILTLPIFTRLISKEDYGAWALANVYAVFVAGLANVGLPLGYERNFFQHREARAASQLLYSVLAFLIAAFATCTLLTWLFGPRLSGWVIGAPRYHSLLLLSMVATGTSSLKTIYMTYLRNSEAAAAFARYTIAERVLSAVASIALVAWLRVGVIGLVIGQVIGTAGVLLVLAARFFPKLPPSFSAAFLRDALRIGYPLTPRVFLGVVSKNFDKYLIGQIASIGGVGIYSIGQRIAYVAFTYATALENVFTPQVYSRMFSLGEQGGASIGSYLTPFAYASAAIAFAIAIFSEEILRVLTPAGYHTAGPVVAVLALFYGIQFFGKVPQLAYAKKTHLITVLSAVGLVLNVGFGIVCIRLWGVMGAAWGVLSAGLVSIMLALAVGQRYYRIEWERRKLLLIFGVLFAGVFVTIGLRQLGVDYPIRLAAKLALLGLYAWVGVRLRYITRENFGVARDLVLRRPAQANAGANA
jgi:O-antigen/teichoic acid export membrane protein